jgi:hypothetical protein
MKHLISPTAIIILACSIFLSACGNTSGNKATAPDAKTSSSPLTGRDGRFAYTINGQHVETVNNVQNANLFINEVSNDPGNGMVKITVTCLSSNVFDFNIANTGTTTINEPQSSSSLTAKQKATYMDGKTLKNLYAVSFTATVASKDNSRISGTFSGTFKAEQSDGGATATVTSGSFDLPFVKN